MKTLRAGCLFSTALVGLLGGCSLQLYDKKLDDQAQGLKSGLATVSFTDTFNQARDNHAAVSDVIAAQHQHLAEISAKLKLLAVLGTKKSLPSPEGLQGVVNAKWQELTCNSVGDPTCATPAQKAAAWFAEFCPDDRNRLCLGDGPPHYSEIVAQGLVDYDPNSPERLQVALKDGASQVMALSLKAAPDCIATQPIEEKQPGDPLSKPVAAMPTAAEFEGSLPADRTDAADLYELVYLPRCNDLLMAQYRLDWLMQPARNSSIGRALNAWHIAREAWNEKQSAARAARAKYDQLNQAYKDALKELEARRPGAAEKAKKLLQEAGHALDALSVIQDLKTRVPSENPVGSADQAEERLQKLREIVAALGGGTQSTAAGGDAKSQLPDDVRSRLAAIATLPRLIDDSARMFEEAEKARLAPLTLEISYQEQASIAANRRVAAAAEEMERTKQAYFAVVAEAGTIAEAVERVDVGMRSLERADSRPLYELLAGADGNPTAGQDALLDALALYYQSQVKQELAIQKISYQSAAAAYKRNLDEDEIALNEWLALVRSDSDILAAYFASGMKAEDVAALLVQLVTLGGIAVGVNR